MLVKQSCLKQMLAISPISGCNPIVITIDSCTREFVIFILLMFKPCKSNKHLSQIYFYPTAFCSIMLSFSFLSFLCEPFQSLHLCHYVHTAWKLHCSFAQLQFCHDTSSAPSASPTPQACKSPLQNVCGTNINTSPFL